MKPEPDDWPPHHEGLHGHLHAIGTLIANWNEMESSLRWYVYVIFPKNIQSGQRVSEQLKHEGRENFIKTEMAAILSNEEKERFEYFFECINIIKENRNAFVHAQYIPIKSGNTLLIARKRDKLNPAERQISMFPVHSLREMADAAKTFADFGLNVVTAIHVRLAKEAAGKVGRRSIDFPLPDKPQRPRKWEEILEASPQRPPQPRSSRR